MPSFKTTSNSFDDEEFFMLSDLFEWKNAFLLHKDYSTFNLNEMTESECLSEFRFGKRDILIHVIAVFHIKFISPILCMTCLT